MKSANSLYGAVLIGGKSSRMGRDKSQLKYEGNSFFDQTYKTLKTGLPDASTVLISGSMAKSVGFRDLPLVPDVFLERGPLGGIHALLNSIPSNEALLLVVPVDMPLLSVGSIRSLCALVLSEEAQFQPKSEKMGSEKIEIWKFENQYFPMVIRKSKDLVQDIEGRIKSHVLGRDISIQDFIKNRVSFEIPSNEFFRESFINVNTPEEYAEIRTEGTK